MLNFFANIQIVDLPHKVSKSLNVSYFIASKINRSEHSSFTATIIRLAIGTVALSIAVMILTNSLVSGFKNQIKSKVFDFWGHIQLAPPNTIKLWSRNL